MCMRPISEEQKQLEQDRAIEAFHAIERRRYKTGRLLLVLCAVTHIVGALVNFFIFYNVLFLIAEVLFSILLLCGVAWSRYVIASVGVVDVTVLLFVVCSGYLDITDPRYAALSVGFVVAYVLYEVVTIALLYTSKAMSFYLYERKH